MSIECGFRSSAWLMLRAAARCCTTLHQLSYGVRLQDDGVDGRMIYIYGEAWDFGEVAGNQRGRNAAQMNLAGGLPVVGGGKGQWW